MINPVLERRFADCSELVDAWKSYLELFNKYVKGDASALNAEVEQRFMEVKARIAMLHDSFIEALRHDQNIGQNMIALVNRSITLRHLKKLSASDQKKIEIEWHEVYLLLNETVSQLGEEREKLANVNEFNHKMDKLRETIVVRLKAFVGSIYFKLIVAFTLLVGIIVGVPLFGIYDWDNLAKVKGIGGPYSAFMDFRRDTLGMNAPYSGIAKFQSRWLDSAKMPAGFKVADGSATKEASTSYLANAFKIDGQDAAQYLNTAAEFKSVTITVKEQGALAAYIFLWSDPAFAGKASTGIASAFAAPENENVRFMANSMIAFGDNNVLVVVAGGGPDDRAAVKRELFKK